MSAIFSLCRKMFSCVLPKPRDMLLIVFAIFLMSALMALELFKSLDLRMAVARSSPVFEFSLLLISGIAIASGLGTYPAKFIKRIWWFMAGLLMTLAYCAYLFYRENCFDSFERLHGNPQASPGLGLALTIGVMVAVFGMTKLILFAIAVGRRRFNLGSITRQKLIIGAAVIMFAILTFRNVSSQFNLVLNSSGWYSSPLTQMAIGAVGLFLGAALPGWGMSLVRARWALPLGFVYLLTIAALSGALIEGTFTMFIVLYAFVFPFIVVAMKSYADAVNPYPEQQGENQLRTGFSVWGIGAPVFAIALAVILWNYSGQALVLAGPNRIQTARQLKRIATRPGVRAHFEVSNNFNTAYIASRISLSDNAKANSLADFQATQFLNGFEFSNLTPKTETHHVRNLNKWAVFIQRSSLTMEQLDDLSNLTNNLTLFDTTFRSKDPSKKFPFSSNGNFRLQNIPPGEIAKLLRSIDSEKFPGRVSISGTEDLSDDDWIEVLESSKSFSIHVSAVLSDKAIELALAMKVPSQLSITRVVDRTHPKYWELVCDSLISLMGAYSSFPSTEQGLQEFWDAAFASRGTEWAFQLYQQQKANSSDFVQIDLGDQSHWIYERGASGDPTKMLIPFEDKFISEMDKFTQLEELSFDIRWLDSLRKNQDSAITSSRDYSALGKLTKLKRLLLPTDGWGRDYAFLKDLPELEHLQLDVFANGNKNVVFGFKSASCPNLKSLVLSGNPSKAFAMEIAKLPNLKTLKVLDVDSSLFSPAAVEQLQKTIGTGIKLTVVPIEDDHPEVPADFTEHLKEVRQKIRTKYLGE